MTSSTQLLNSYLESGLRKHQDGQIEAAAAEYRRALVLAPRNPEALQLLGAAELQLGNAQDAVKHLESAARALPDRPGILGNLGQAYLTLGRFADAHEMFRKANQLDPSELEHQIAMAVTHAMQGRLDEAEALLRSVAEQHPREVLAWFNLGNVLRDQRKHIDAMDCYIKALEIEPQYADAHNNLGSVLHALTQFDDAEREYRVCLKLDPAHVQAQFNLASVTIDAGKFADAEAVSREMVARAPHEAIAYTVLGAALSHQGKTGEALQCYRRAAELAPDDARAAETHAGALAGAGRIEEALAEFARALAIDPELESVRCSRGAALLAAGRFGEGWEGYLHRGTYTNISEKYPGVSLTRALPDDLRGASMLLLGDQGLGDELFFLRYAPGLSAAGVALTYYGSSKVKPLLERVESLALVLDESDALPQAAATILVGDLPYALNEYAMRHRSAAAPDRLAASQETPPPLMLTAEAECLNAMRARLRQAGDPPYIGVTWRAGIPPREQTGSAWNLFKTIEPTSLATALRATSGTVLALQRNPFKGEIERCSTALGRPLHDFSDLNEDLEAMLALLALIDEYVAVSNTNVHLRTGVGKHVRVLVPQPADWRWMVSGDSSPWFPGSCIYRQSQDGDWSDALSALARDLRAR